MRFTIVGGNPAALAWLANQAGRGTTHGRNGYRPAVKDPDGHAVGWWCFPASTTDEDALARLAREGYTPGGFRGPVLSAWGDGWRDVRPMTCTRKGSRLLVTQRARTTDLGG